MAAPTPIYSVGKYLPNYGIQLNANVGLRQFQIVVDADTFAANLDFQDKYIAYFENHKDNGHLTPADYANPDNYESTLDILGDFITKPLFELFENVEPLEKRVYTLQDCLYPEMVRYTLYVKGDAIVPKKLLENADRELMGVSLPRNVKELQQEITWTYNLEEIEVRLPASVTSLPPRPTEVYINGILRAYLKYVEPKDVDKTVTRLLKYRKIDYAGFGKEVKVSELEGIVALRSGPVIGLLLSYIDCGEYPLTLSQAIQHSKPGRDLKEKWLKQIKHSLRELHAKGIVWGTPNEDSVLIAKNGDAFLVDFGEKEYDRKERKNAMERDWRGAGRIARYL